jgi:hypothetical protein
VGREFSGEREGVADLLLDQPDMVERFGVKGVRVPIADTTVECGRDAGGRTFSAASMDDDGEQPASEVPRRPATKQVFRMLPPNPAIWQRSPIPSIDSKLSIQGLMLESGS